MKKRKILAVLLLSGCVAPAVTDVPQRRASAPEVTTPPRPMASFAPQAAPRVTRSNSSIAADFLDLTFQMESGRPILTFSRFEGPISVATKGKVPASAARDLSALLARLRTEARLDIKPAADPATASITVEFLPRAEMQAAVPQAACFVVPRVGSWEEFRAARGTAQIDWTTLTERSRATVFVPADVSPQEQRDCLHEELAQALGPLNDLYHLSDSVFNDDNFNTILTGFDMMVLRATYAPELRSGMGRAEVAARLPGLLARINPAGGRGGIGPSVQTPRDWISAIEAALNPRSSNAARRAAAERALAMAQAQGWTDNRRAFSHFVEARLTLGTEVEASVVNFAEAGQFYARLPGGALHLAHVDMQMAAFALNAGQYDRVSELARRATPAVKREQNAAILATLMFLDAAARDAAGRHAEAAAIRLDSQPWARYGFGSEAQVRARMSEVNALARRNTFARE